MPDEPDPQVGAAVATAELPPEDAPDILPKDSPEPVPAAEQEPGDGKPESVASGPEDEGDKEVKAEEPDVRDQLKEQLEAIRKDDPELFNEVAPAEERERLQGSDTSDIEQREVALAQRERQAKRGQAEQAYAGQKGTLLQSVKASLQAVHDDIARQAQAVQDPDQTATQVTPDWRDVGTSVEQMQRQTEAATWNYVTKHVTDSLTDALALHPSARHLNAKDREAIKDASEDERLAVMLTAQLDAAMQRGASETTRAAAKKEAEEVVGMAEHLQKVTALMGNGTGKRAEAGGKGAKTYKSREEVHAAHADDEITTPQARKLLAGFTE